MMSCPSFGHYPGNYQVEHYFPGTFHCHVMKRRLSTALSLDSPNFFTHVHCPLNLKYVGSQLVILNAPHNQNLKYAICFNSIMKSCHSNKKS